MNRSTSIKDIGNIYREMQKRNASLVSESVLEEASKKKSNKVKAKMPKDTFPLAGTSVKEPSTLKKSGPKNVKNLNKPKKNKNFSQKTKKIDEGDINNFMSIFDKLYENVMNNDELDINTGIGTGPEGDAGDSDLDLGLDDSDTDSDLGGENEVTITLDKDLAKQLLDVLKDVVGEDDSDSDLEALGVDTDSESDTEDDDEDEQSEKHDGDCDEQWSETTDIEKLPDSAGHKLQKGFAAAGNIKASSGKADAKVTDTVGTETGKHPLDHKSELTNPSKNKVGGLKTGKSLFDQ
jgi:hypothetical protein